MAEILATLGHNGATIDATAGDVLTIRLPENPTTGYRWQQETDNHTAKILGCIGDAFESAAGALGSSGTRILRFSAHARGAATLRFDLKRPWESGKPPRETYSLHVVVA